MAKEKEEKKGPKPVFGERTRTPMIRTSFVYFLKPDVSERKESDGKYKFIGMIENERKEELKPLKLAILKVAKEAFGADTKFGDIQTPFKDGDERAEEKERLANYAGHVVFNIKSKDKPGIIVGKAKTKYSDLSDEEKEELNLDVGGYWVIATVTPASYIRTVEVEKSVNGKTKRVNEERKGVTLYLNNIWFIKDDERFGGGGNAESDFQDVELDDEEFGSEEEGSGDELDDELDEKPKASSKGGKAEKKKDEDEDEAFDDDDLV
jgi:hypothetical protein